MVGVGVGSLLAEVVGFVRCNSIGDEVGYVTMALDWKKKGLGF